ncbi:hypothetical protein GCM10023185_15290 [Hymenobacter saemangeumensis]|uniref:Uncharacterized protein n=1 Tax=Hymenobacter saemangeumensis TaxID=1084522 RepID=A0ABP8I9K2_9BACT
MTLANETPARSTAVIVLFGGNPHRRQEVMQLLAALGPFTVFGSLSEAEGMELLRTLPAVDLVLIGGRYSEEQRQRIRAYVHDKLPRAKISEPGHAYPYENSAIAADVARKIGLDLPR